MSERAIDLRSTDGITVVTINRPEKRNAMTRSMCEELEHAWLRFRDSEDKVAVLVGSGDVFCAGADLRDPPSEFWRALPDVGVDIGKPVISAVQGPAIGLGLAMVVFSDLCVAATSARFIYPEARLGVSKGLMAALSVRVSHKVAMELMLLGEPMPAQRAYDVGLVNRLAEPGAEFEQAMQMAATANQSAPLVLRMLKKFVRDTVPASPIEQMYRAQLETDKVLNSSDASAGLAAFREKRIPVFTGR